MSEDTDRLRVLNDEFRRKLPKGHTFITPGIAALGEEAVTRLIQTLRTYDDFCRENDPHEEHDFGAFDFDGKSVFFKIDYYDKDLKFGSPNPADTTQTARIITLMLAGEY